MNFIYIPPIPKHWQRLTGTTLKMIAVVTMFIDHFARGILYANYILPNAPVHIGTPLHKFYLFYRFLRGIGRIAFPIFCFLLIEGFFHTRSRKRYALNLAVFAIISEIPFNLLLNHSISYPKHNNVMLTLLIGFLVMWGIEYFKEKVYLQIPIAVFGGLLAWVLKTDYDYKGIILIVIFYFFYNYRTLQALVGGISLYWEWPAMFSFIPICMYNGKEGRKMKHLFYIFYPAHMLIIALISMYVIKI